MQIIPLHAKTTFNSDDVGDEPVLLIDITDSSLNTAVIRLCSFPVIRLSVDPLLYGVVSGGNTYTYALTGSIPSDQENTDLTGSLAIDNVDQSFTNQFVGLSSKNTLLLQLILASDPDTIIKPFPLLKITNCDVSEDTLTITYDRNHKVYGDGSNLEPWPSGKQTVEQAPGLHK